MPEIIELDSLHHPGAQIFASLTDHQLSCGAFTSGSPLMMVESPKVINVALDAGMEPVALMCERRHITGDAATVLARCREDMPVYTGSRELLSAITGYKLTRGVLCAMARPELPSVEQICHPGAQRVAVIDSVSDTTNIGAIFRSAAALGVDGVLLTPTSCDPLNRRSIRVSMGSVFLVPWTWLPGPVSSLRSLGMRTVALALSPDSVSIDDAALAAEPRLALVLGTEGDGLSHNVIQTCDYVARIPMQHGVDSLNVAAASAVTFWQLCHPKP